jgi:prophage regulatory protein
MQHSEQPPNTPGIEGQRRLFLRMPLVVRLTGHGRSTIYRLIAERRFPPQVKLQAERLAGGPPTWIVGANRRHPCHIEQVLAELLYTMTFRTPPTASSTASGIPHRLKPSVRLILRNLPPGDTNDRRGCIVRVSSATPKT